MLRNCLYYYGVKPWIPVSFRLEARRWLALRKREKMRDVWPIMPGSEKPPSGWPGWPEGKKFALVLTHDVEGPSGMEKCRTIMALEKELGFRSSFSLIPRGGYEVTEEFRRELCDNGFEVAVHDLYHDGKLFLTRNEFNRNAPEINKYLREWSAAGFRSGFMLHNLDWLLDLEIKYDLSTFDTDPFEPQPHGRHTIFPFWVPRPGSTLNSRLSTLNSSAAGYVELPYTLPQDSTLFLILGERTPDIWLQKLDWIAKHGGMALIDTHPDYMAVNGGGPKPWEYPIEFYKRFLEYVRARYSSVCWNALPNEVAGYWKETMVPRGHIGSRMERAVATGVPNFSRNIDLSPMRKETQIPSGVTATEPAANRQDLCSVPARGAAETRPALGRVTIFGMGYVGCVSAACLAKNGFEVAGVDMDANKVALINSGLSPITEPGLEDVLGKVVETGALSATVDAKVLGDLSLVCVGTPSNENGSLDLGQVLHVCEEIGRLLKGTDSYHVVNFRSTVVPGTVEKLLIPLLELRSGKIAGQHFGVCMNPEFLRESTAIADFYSPPFTVIGALDERSADTVVRLYSGIDAPLEVVSIRTAEMIKYTCNSFHALKVSFANEIGNLCKSFGVDSWRVMEIFCRDTKLNLSPYYLKPGFAFGGSCLPKDLRAIVHLARQRDIDVPVLGSILASNELQIDRAYRMIKRTGKRKVGVLGLSFKAGSDDLRESPTVALIERLIGKGYSVSIYDDDVSLPEIRGKNRLFIERTLPHIALLMRSFLAEVIENSEVVAICKKRKEFEAALAGLNGHQPVVDLVRLFQDGTSPPALYEGICW